MDIDLPLYEIGRPPMHKIDKYVGKKPINIWSKYIETYTQQNEIVLDMFGGSGVAAIEALVLGRRVISNDLNSMHDFRIETFLKSFDKSAFLEVYKKLINKFKEKAKQLSFFNTSCPNCSSMCSIINTIWSDKGNKLDVIGYECKSCDPIPHLREPNKHWFQKSPDDQDKVNFEILKDLEIEYWYPNKSLPLQAGAFSSTFLKDLGNPTYDNLWSKQNLFFLSYQFDEIIKIDNKNIRHHLLFAFLKSCRLCFGKMNYPRDPKKGNRNWSTSWGRSGFLYCGKQVHMSPLVQFERAIEEKQGLLKGLENKNLRMGNNITYTRNVDDFFNNNKQLLILNKDSTLLDQDLPENSVDFILTDPPYGDVVPYFTMESIYSCWLEKIDPRYKIDFNNELTIRNNNYEEYEQKFLRCFKSAKKILKPNKKAVITFHSKDLKVWSLIQKSLEYAGFKKEKIILQPNKRSGETVAANPYSQTSNDYYLRYLNIDIKNHNGLNISIDQIKNIILTEAIEILAKAAEPIAKVLLEPGIIKKLFNYGYSLQVTPDLIDEVLFEKIGENFEVLGNKKKPESFWSLINFEYQHIPLQERTETIVHDLIVRENIVSFDQIYKTVFSTFTDNLTPPYRDLTRIISKFAKKINVGENKGKWKLKIETQQTTSEHDLQIGHLAEIGNKLEYDVWVGSVEQGHMYKEQALSCLMNSNKLEIENYNNEQLSEIKQIDLIWYKNKKIKAIFEVEHSTSIISALRRGSQISDNNIKRYIIIKESGSQRNLLNKLSRNPFFKREFEEKSWEVKYYNNVKSDYKNVINNNESSKFL
jgi:DNA modification methylase